MYNFTVTATQQFNITVIGNLQGNLTTYGGGLYSFSTNYTNAINATVTLLANDTLGSASVLTPQLQICGCLNGGICTQGGILDVNQNPLFLNCQCSKGMHHTAHGHLAELLPLVSQPQHGLESFVDRTMMDVSTLFASPA